MTYARLGTLEWANEVAKAARGTTSVATIEPPVHAPYLCDPVSGPTLSSRISGVVSDQRVYNHTPGITSRPVAMVVMESPSESCTGLHESITTCLMICL